MTFNERRLRHLEQVLKRPLTDTERSALLSGETLQLEELK